MGLQRTRQQGHTIESIHEAMLDLRQIYPNAGAREMISLLFHEKGMSVARTVIRAYFAIYEPDLVRERKAQRLKRKRFWAAGVNDLFATLGHIPMVTQSDPGTENYGIANAHTMLRQWHDPALQGTLQHRWMRTKKNVMPAITWSQLRRRFTPGFESILDRGVDEGWYDSSNTLQVMVFCWVFIPWLQRELDAYWDRMNNTAKRRDRNKVLPHGVPNLIYNSPEDFGALDFKITAERDAIDHVRGIYINPNHPVFDLVPANLNNYIQQCYKRMGCPIVDRGSAWTVYCALLNTLQHNSDLGLLDDTGDEDSDGELEDLPLLDNHQDLPFNEVGYYMGGVGGGLGLDTVHHRQLESLVEEDEPDVPVDGDVNLVGLDHDGLVVWDFSNNEDDEISNADQW
ncbi:hypothetical protein P692DRAFT_20878373 [Suillus brevipes Sb2]|nr:hypothetical protein P692DRAFT_20878373 [Suillus brevipes Sb2]